MHVKSFDHLYNVEHSFCKLYQCGLHTACIFLELFTFVSATAAVASGKALNACKVCYVNGDLMLLYKWLDLLNLN